jgi:uridine kinase
LIDRAARELNVDRRSSWMVGDTSADILAGRRAGVRTIGVRTGHASEDGKYEVEPDFLVPDLASAVDWILQDHPALATKLAPVACAAADARFVLVGGPARSGKSMAARVLCDLLGAVGRTCHVVNLDGWLKPVHERPDWMPALERYDLARAAATLLPLARADQRIWIRLPRYDRRGRSVTDGPPRTIGERDLVVVEGVPALLDWPLRSLVGVRLFVDVPEALRQQRLTADYAWRGVPSVVLDELLRQRERSELQQVRASAAYATHHIETGLTS